MADIPATDEVRRLCQELGIVVQNPAIIQQALIHSSYANEAKTGPFEHNERLEYLGDAVLNLVVGEYLYRTFPSLPEGELSKARAAVVCEPSLAKRAKELALGSYLRLGKGEDASGGRERPSILADAFEALIGAVYLDKGFVAATQFVLDNLDSALAEVENGEYARDFKTLLQEKIQRRGEARITYEVVDETGPDHNKTFTVAVTVNAAELGVGTGKTKKEAEQNAARVALAKVKKR